MQYFNLISLALLPSALAYGYGSSDTSSSGVSQKATTGVHVVKVGQNGLTFEPNNLTVPVGETVEFHFWPKAHSVAQSSFQDPCQPLNTTGFFSGPIAIASGMSPTVFRVKINNTNPIWYYCATGNHCQSGMGGVINSPNNTQRTITTYLAAAAKAASNVAPSSVTGGELATTSGTPTGTGSASSGTASAAAAAHASLSWAVLGAAGLVGGYLL